MKIITNSKISAVYFALLQCGYDFFNIERSKEHIDTLKRFISTAQCPKFFNEVRQNTCAVYPYWPRAFLLETAAHFIDDASLEYRNFDLFKEKVFSASNISDAERGEAFWDWIVRFPEALSTIMKSKRFAKYVVFVKQWVEDQNAVHKDELDLVQNCLEICTERYGSTIRDIEICLDPIKCVYSSDYTLLDSRFIFTSGAFRADAVVHEFLHHVVHPYIEKSSAKVLAAKQKWNDLDESYYLSGDDAGILNAFEEHTVRVLSADILACKYPHDLNKYILLDHH
ncbi:MAG: hypothetical protein IKS90_00325 [Clostridia bacterium]|nr:hypothetical protein [Clostridia bacterium]